MMHLSPQRSKSWTARIIAGVALCVAGTVMADDAAPVSSARATPTSTATAPTSASAPAPKVICFQSSIRCFTAKSAPLDLRAPAITRVFSEAELQQKLEEPQEIHETETVQVQGERQLTPVSVGLMAIPWAVIHPTQAWRIFMPVPDAK